MNLHAMLAARAEAGKPMRVGKRCVASFGFRYDFNGGGLQEAAPLPDFLLPVREHAAALAGAGDDILTSIYS